MAISKTPIHIDNISKAQFSLTIFKAQFILAILKGQFTLVIYQKPNSYWQYIKNLILIGNIKSLILIGNIKNPIHIGNIKNSIYVGTNQFYYHCLEKAQNRSYEPNVHISFFLKLHNTFAWKYLKSLWFKSMANYLSKTEFSLAISKA